MKILSFKSEKTNSQFLFFRASGDSPDNVNRSTDERLSGDMAEQIEARMAATRLGLDILEAQIRPALTVRTFHGSSLRLRNNSGQIIGSLANASWVTFAGETKITRDANGQTIDTDVPPDGSLDNRHLWFKVTTPSGQTGWASAEYLAGSLTEVPAPEPPTTEIPLTESPPQTNRPEPISGTPECRDGHIVYVHPETGEVLRTSEEICGEPQPFEFSIDQIFPEFAEYVDLDPTLPGWFQYTEAFNQVPLGRQREIQTEIEAVLRQRIADAFASGIDAKIAAAQAAGDTEQENYLEAMKALSPLTGGGSGNITVARQQLALAGTPGQEVLDTMNHDFSRINQGQLMALFEATESSAHEAIVDNWAITNYFSENDEVSQERINLIHKVGPVVLEIFQTRQADFSSILEVIDDAIANPGALPSNITLADLQTFKSFWETYVAGSGRQMAQLDTNDADFLEQMQATSQTEWLNLAKQMNEEGQYDQAQQILEQIVLGAQLPSGNSVEDQLSTLLTSPQIAEITADVEREIEREMPRDQVIQMYEEQGFFTNEGLEGFGLIAQAGDTFLDPISATTITKPQAINLIVDQAINVTREKLTTEKMLWEVSNDDRLLNMVASGTLTLDAVQTEALNLYKDISGAGAEWGNLSSKRADFWREELLLNVGLIAISATGVGLLAAGGRVVALGSRVFSGTRLATSTTRIARLTRGVTQFATTAVVDGAVFHNINAAVSTPIVGAAAFDNYAEGLGHSVGMYATFGAGNVLWGAGVSRVAGGTAFERLSTQTFRDGVRNGWGDAGLTILASQPRLAAEALAFTQIATDAEFGSPEYFEEFGKQLVTMNLLWAMPRVQPRRLMIEDMRGQPATERVNQAFTRPPIERQVSEIRLHQSFGDRTTYEAIKVDRRDGTFDLISPSGQLLRTQLPATAIQSETATGRRASSPQIETLVRAAESRQILGRTLEGVGRVAEGARGLGTRSFELLRANYPRLAQARDNFFNLARRALTRPSEAERAANAFRNTLRESRKAIMPKLREIRDINALPKGSVKTARLAKAEGELTILRESRTKIFTTWRDTLTALGQQDGAQIVSIEQRVTQLETNSLLRRFTPGNSGRREQEIRSLTTEVTQLRTRENLTQVQRDQLTVLETRLNSLRSEPVTTQPVPEPAPAAEPARIRTARVTPRETTPRLSTVSRSLNRATAEQPVTATLAPNSAIIPKINNQGVGVRIETQQTITEVSIIRLTRSFYDSGRRNENLSIRSGETQRIELLNQTLVIRRNGTQIEMHAIPRANYTVEGVPNFTFQVGSNYQIPNTNGQPASRGTFTRQEGESLIFTNRNQEVSIPKTRIDQLVIAGRVSLVD